MLLCIGLVKNHRLVQVLSRAFSHWGLGWAPAPRVMDVLITTSAAREMVNSPPEGCRSGGYWLMVQNHK